MLLAQTPTPPQPAPEQVEAAKAAVVELLKGIPQAAEAQPVQYLNVIVVLAVLVVICVIAWRVLIYLRWHEESEHTAREKRNALEGQRHDEWSSAISALVERDRESQQACHEHSLQMMELRNEGSTIIRDACGEIKGVATEFKAIAGEFKSMQHETHEFITKQMDRIDKPAQVQQIINPIRSPEAGT
jgi:hypothetical protein